MPERRPQVDVQIVLVELVRNRNDGHDGLPDHLVTEERCRTRRGPVVPGVVMKVGRCVRVAARYGERGLRPARAAELSIPSRVMCRTSGSMRDERVIVPPG